MPLKGATSLLGGGGSGSTRPELRTEKATDKTEFLILGWPERVRLGEISLLG